MAKSHYYLKGYTVYLTKQASKVIGVPELHVDTDITPRFDQTRELWYVPYYINGELIKTFELSKEAVLAIEYQHGKEEYTSVVRQSNDEIVNTISSSKHGSTVKYTSDSITMSVR